MRARVIASFLPCSMVDTCSVAPSAAPRGVQAHAINGAVPCRGVARHAESRRERASHAAATLSRAAAATLSHAEPCQVQLIRGAQPGYREYIPCAVTAVQPLAKRRQRETAECERTLFRSCAFGNRMRRRGGGGGKGGI